MINADERYQCLLQLKQIMEKLSDDLDDIGEEIQLLKEKYSQTVPKVNDMI